MQKHFVPQFGHLGCDEGKGVSRGIVIVEKPFYIRQMNMFLSEAAN